MVKENNNLISFILLSYNQENYIRDAIQGALNQTYEPLEIIISDDCSSDKTYEIILQELKKYNGKHTIKLNKNENNLGIVQHFNHVFKNLAKGKYFALAAGDDISLPNRIKVSFDLLNENKLLCISSNAIIIDHFGNESKGCMKKKSNSLKIFTINDYNKKINFNIHGASKFFDRIVFDYFDELNIDAQSEDTTLTFRSLLLGKIGYYGNPLIKYRRHDNNISNESNINKLSYINIYKQYMSDYLRWLDFENDSNNKIIKRLLKYKSRMHKENKIRDNYKLIVFIDYILFSKEFTLYEKLYYLYKTII
jgi:glycosyltransferase involved in cell wall biosynthesis